MSTSNTYLAVFCGRKTSARRATGRIERGTIHTGESVEIMPVLPIPNG